MHLTTGEVALVSVVIGGIIGSLGTAARDLSTENRDHMRRLWEKEVEIYESLLLLSNNRTFIYEWTLLRFKAEEIGTSKLPMVMPETVLDEPSIRRMSVQFGMFGRPEVERAEEKCRRLYDKFMRLAMRAGLLQPTENAKYEAEELVRDVATKEELIKTTEAGYKAELRLADIIRTAVRSSPSDRRRRGLRLIIPRWRLNRIGPRRQEIDH